ncbi:MAG TPA: hypothetical protein VJ476_09120 [Rhizomicrobium sp.]|nr:hypothetical protein [Rhizomicrobium sp.]
MPFTGLAAFVVDEACLIVFTGSTWVDYASILNLQNVPLLGVNTTADATNKLAAKSSAVLFDNVGASMQAKLNKAASGDTASLLYQTGYGGRAELGLCGDDDLHVKVSPDGATWYEGVKVARGSGLVTLIGDPATALGAATKQYVDGMAAGFTSGSVLFSGATGAIAQDNAKLFWDDSNDRLGVGTAAPQATLDVNPTGSAASFLSGIGAQFTSNGTANNLFSLDCYGTNWGFMGRRANGTLSAQTAVLSGQAIFTFNARAHNGTGFATATCAGINFVADENITPTANGGRIDIRATQVGTTTVNTVGQFFGDGRFNFIGAYCDKSYLYQAPTSGFAITAGSAVGRLILDPAGTLASGSITMPAAPKDGQILRLASSQTITALTLTPNTGQSIVGTLSSLTANGFAEYTYRGANTTWYRSG